MLDLILEDVSLFVALNFLGASPFEQFNYVISTFVTLTSMHCGSTLENAAKAMNASGAIEERTNNSGRGIPEAKLVKDVTIINLVEISTLVLLF